MKYTGAMGRNLAIGRSGRILFGHGQPVVRAAGTIRGQSAFRGKTALHPQGKEPVCHRTIIERKQYYDETTRGPFRGTSRGFAGQAQGRDLLDVRNRYLDGSVKADTAKRVATRFLRDSFEDFSDVKAYWDFVLAHGEASDQHVTGGKRSLKVTFKDKNARIVCRRGSMQWGGGPEGRWEKGCAWGMQVLFYDAAKRDVFNPQRNSVTLRITMGTEFAFDLKPGANELTLKVTDMLKECYRATTILESTRLAVASDAPVTLFFDNFRRTRAGKARITPMPGDNSRNTSPGCKVETGEFAAAQNVKEASEPREHRHSAKS